MADVAKGAPIVAVIGVLVSASACTAGMRPPTDPALDFEGPIQSRDVGEGARVYIELCSACHRGRVNPRGYHWSPAQMRHQIRRGNQIMPPLPPELVSDEQLEAVLAYLVVSGALEGELPPSDETQPIDTSHDAAFAGADGFDDERSDDEVASEAVAGDSETESAQDLGDPQ